MQLISYQIKDYTRDHGSIGLFLGNSVFGGEFGSECLGLFLFCFCLVRGEKVASAQDLGWQSKGEDHFRSWFPLFPYLVVTTLYYSDIVWSKDLYAFFFCFLPIFDREFSLFFFLLSSNLLIRNFLFFPFCFQRQGWAFSPWVKVYDKLGFGSRLVERLVTIYVRVWPAVRG